MGAKVKFYHPLIARSRMIMHLIIYHIPQNKGNRLFMHNGELAGTAAPISKLRSISERVGNKLKPREARVVSADEFASMPDPDSLIEGVLEKNSLNMLYGAPGTGKSFIALDIALHVAYGRPWMGRSVCQGGVLYVAAEGGASLGRRLRAWKSYYNNMPFPDTLRFVTEAIDLAGGLQTLESFLVDAIGALPTHSIMTEIDENGTEHLIEPLELPPVELIVFDTLSRCSMGADENSAMEMGKIVQWLDILKDKGLSTVAPAILLVHHTGKYTDQERGSTVMRGAMDTMMHVKQDARGPMVRCTKQKNQEEFEDLRFILAPLKDTPKYAVLLPRAEEEAGSTMLSQVMSVAIELTDRQATVLRAVATAGKEEGIKPIDVWRDAEVRAHIPSAPNVYRVLESLLGRSMVTKGHENRYFVTQKGVSWLVENKKLVLG